MDKNFAELLEFLQEYLVKRGFTIQCSLNTAADNLPLIDGHKPDLVATYKNVKTVYGKVELPENCATKEQWNRLRALSADTSVELYIAFPEQQKLQLVLSLINGKLSDRQNIIRLYR